MHTGQRPNAETLRSQLEPRQSAYPAAAAFLGGSTPAGSCAGAKPRLWLGSGGAAGLLSDVRRSMAARFHSSLRTMFGFLPSLNTCRAHEANVQARTPASVPPEQSMQRFRIPRRADAPAMGRSKG